MFVKSLVDALAAFPGITFVTLPLGPNVVRDLFGAGSECTWEARLDDIKALVRITVCTDKDRRQACLERFRVLVRRGGEAFDALVG